MTGFWIFWDTAWSRSLDELEWDPFHVEDVPARGGPGTAPARRRDDAARPALVDHSAQYNTTPSIRQVLQNKCSLTILSNTKIELGKIPFKSKIWLIKSEWG